MKTRVLTSTVLLAVITLVNSQPDFPFTAFTDNPILECTPGSWDEGFIQFPFVYYEANTFYLFYTGGLEDYNSPTYIGMATSMDGYNYIKQDDPVFEPDGVGFDGVSVSFPVVFKKEGIYYLYYTGADDIGACTDGHIGQASATSIYGPWVRMDDPIIEQGSQGEWDHAAIVPESVFETDSGTVLYYTGCTSNPLSPEATGLAYQLGEEWIKYDSQETTNPPYAESDPILNTGSPGSWDQSSASLSDVNQFNNGWEIFYMGYGNYGWCIGHAISENGVNWTNASEYFYNYLNDPFALNSGLSITANPNVVVVENVYFMYYDYGGPSTNFISLATAPGQYEGFYNQTYLHSISTMNIVPNPVKKETLINYFVHLKAPVKLSIHNYNGQLILTLSDKVQQHGEQKINFNTTELPAGIYFCVLKTSEGIQTRKLIKL